MTQITQITILAEEQGHAWGRMNVSISPAVIRLRNEICEICVICGSFPAAACRETDRSVGSDVQFSSRPFVFIRGFYLPPFPVQIGVRLKPLF